MFILGVYIRCLYLVFILGFILGYILGFILGFILVVYISGLY